MLIQVEGCFTQNNAAFEDNEARVMELLVQAEDLLSRRNFDSMNIITKNALYLAQQLAIDTLIGQSYMSLAKAADFSNNYYLADSLYNLAIHYFQNDRMLANIYFLKKDCLERLGSVDSLPKYLDLAKAHLDRVEGNKNSEILHYYMGYADYYGLKNLISKEVDYLFKAREVAVTEADFFEVNYQLSYAFREIGEHDYALELLLNSWQFTKDSKDKKMELYTLYGLTSNRLAVGEHDEVKKFANEALKLRKSSGISSAIGYIYACLGESYLLENKLDSAAYYFKEGIKISHIQNEKKELGDNYIGMVYWASKQGDVDALKFYGNEIKKLDLIILDKKVNPLLADQYAKEGNYKKAYELIMANLDDYQKGNSTDKNKIISSLISEKITQKNKLEQLELEQQLEQRRYQLTLSLSLGGLALLIIAGMIWAYQQIRKRNELLKKDLENKKMIESQAAELQKTDALKSRLFANISHELRTPLTLISNPIKSLLTQKSLDDQTKATLSNVLFNSEQLLEKSNQIMELTKAEVKDIEVTANAFNLRPFLQHFKSKFQLLATHKGIDLRIATLERDVPLITDAKKLETILGNLLSNALKYIDDKGKINVQIVELANQIEIIVADNGRGISEEDLPFIFDRYYQAKSGTIVAEGGVGIGLAICKEYIQLLEGNILVKSKFGTGSQFIIQFPKQLKQISENVKIQPAEFSIIRKKNSSIPTLTNSKNQIDYLLIVEDNLEMCSYLKNVLETDYDLIFAYNGKEALRRIEEKLPSLIITDLMMPVMGGMELVNRIKEQARLRSLPILVLTAKNNVLDELKALRIGVDDYLLKPFDELELKTHIYNLLNFSDTRQDFNPIDDDFLLDSKIQTSAEQYTLSLAERNWLIQVEEIITASVIHPDLNVNTLAKELLISPTLLNTKMKNITGLTPKKYINEVRLLIARKKIENKEYTSVKEAAYSVGFNSEKAFSRNFKARYGKYPSAYLR